MIEHAVLTFVGFMILLGAFSCAGYLHVLEHSRQTDGRPR